MDSTFIHLHEIILEPQGDNFISITPSSFFLWCASIMSKHFIILMSQERIVPSWEPEKKLLKLCRLTKQVTASWWPANSFTIISVICKVSSVFGFLPVLRSRIFIAEFSKPTTDKFSSKNSRQFGWFWVMLLMCWRYFEDWIVDLLPSLYWVRFPCFLKQT